MAIRSGEQNRKDTDGDFIRKCGVPLAGAGGNLIIVTPRGKHLGEQPNSRWDVRRAWQQWQMLPESERRPGAVQVAKQGPIDANTAPPSPPPGGLILKLYYRTLAGESKGELRHVETKDFIHNYSMAKDPKNPHETGQIDLSIKNQAFFEANPDFLWLTEAEWKSLLPANPKKGTVSPVPGAIRERIFRYHLDPTMAFGESLGWPKSAVRGGELTLTVEEVTQEKVRLRLDGFAQLGPDFKTVEAKVRENHRIWGYEPRLLGYLEYSPKTKVVTRFDIVALGDTYGMLEGNLKYFYRPGRHPLGVAFELVHGDVPANNVPPRGAKAPDLHQLYFATGH